MYRILMCRPLAGSSWRCINIKPLSSSPGALATSTVAVFDVRRPDTTELRLRCFPLMKNHLLIKQDCLVPCSGKRRASTKQGYQLPNATEIACNFINMMKCVDLNDMKDTPPAAFWSALVIGSSQLVIPFLELIGGYCPFLTLLQLHVAVTTLGFYGGTRWGLAMCKSDELATRETLRWALVTPGIAVVALALPYPLGFLTAASGMVTSLYLDLGSCVYERWVMATRLYMTLTTVTGLLLAMAAYVLFNNRNAGKEESEDPKLEEEKDKKDQLHASDVMGKARFP